MNYVTLFDRGEPQRFVVNPGCKNSGVCDGTIFVRSFCSVIECFCIFEVVTKSKRFN